MSNPAMFLQYRAGVINSSKVFMKRSGGNEVIYANPWGDYPIFHPGAHFERQIAPEQQHCAN